MAANCTVLPFGDPMTSDPGSFRDLAWVIVAASPAARWRGSPASR